SALIKNNNEIIGILGKIHSDFVNKYDISEHLYLFEIDIDALLKISDNSPKFKEFSRYPFTIRDMSLLIPKTLEYSIIAQTIKALNIEILESFELASIYEHESIGLENRGILIKFKYQSLHKTLTDDEIEAAHKTIFNKLSADLKIKPR
ncbi:MAG TPA: hypothetical protein PLM75_12660, partial [bacterium]|nr:hypothetical protein [bacterium]